MVKIRLAGFGLALGLMMLAGAVGRTQALKTFTFAMQGIRIVEEDDPVSNDEPYVINVYFKGHIQLAGGNATMEENTLSVETAPGDVHNDLGRDHDNWGDAGNTYRITGFSHEISVPSNEPNYIAGVIAVLFEEDNFSNRTANRLRDEIRVAARDALRNLSVTDVDTDHITRVIAQKISHDISRAASRLDFAHIIQGLAEGVDPDDFGGINMVLAITLPRDVVMVYTGPPQANLADVLPALVTLPANGSRSFSLEYPVGVPRNVPSNAKYTGKCRVGGRISQAN